jgi:hypothetical protein
VEEGEIPLCYIVPLIIISTSPRSQKKNKKKQFHVQIKKTIGGILGQLCEPRTNPRLDCARMENVPKRTKDGVL